MSAAERRARLEALNALKLGKRKDYSADRNVDIYDEVSDDEYRAIVKGRLEQDDFIEDDDGSGYVDQGVDEWEQQRGSSDGEASSDGQSKYRNPKKKKAQEKPQPTAASTLQKKPLLRKANGEAAAATAVSDYRKPKAAPLPMGDDSTFMAGLLGELDSAPPTVHARPSLAARKRKSSPEYNLADLSSRPRPGGGGYASSSSFGSDPLFEQGGSTSGSDPLEPEESRVVVGVSRTGKKARFSGVEEPMAGLDVDHQGPTLDVDLDIGADGMDVDDAEEDIVVVAAERKKPAATNRSRALVNAAAVRAKPVIVKPEPTDDDELPPAAVGLAKNRSAKPKGVDWRTAMQTLSGGDEAKPFVAGLPDFKSEDAATDEDTPSDYLANMPRKISAAQAKKRAEQQAEKELGPPVKVTAFEEDVKPDVKPGEAGEGGQRLKFFWLDYHEANGIVHLFGKVWDRGTGGKPGAAVGLPGQGPGKWVSCCVTVRGIERNLFFLPRDSYRDEDDEVQVPTEDDVYDDVEEVLKSANISEFKAKQVKRRYAFEVKDVPRESDKWLKVVYGFNQPALPLTLQGKTFSRVFGANTSAFELLVLKRKIMGPCWLDIRSARPHAGKPISWCKLEVTVDDPKTVNPFSESDPEAPKDTPALTITSISVREIVNHKENKREIVALTMRTWRDTNLDDPTPIEKQRPMTVQTFVRPLGQFPEGFAAAAKALHTDSSGPAPVDPLASEQVILNKFLAVLVSTDPDVLIGHEFAPGSLETIVARMRVHKTPLWSRLGRFRRDRAPELKAFGGTRLSAQVTSGTTTGRLVCELASDGFRGLIASTSWSLTEMCSTHLKISREDLDPDDTADFFDSAAPGGAEKLLRFVDHCAADSMFQAMLAHKVQVLPLTKQLTNLAGNGWNQTLGGSRALRNEYILLHEFHRQKYVCPDKMTFKDKREVALANAVENPDGEDMEAGKKGGKKDKYKGGLVFEPKKGLWDRFILVMDFNSLYPSIIQEYNIDFTTVDRSGDHAADINWLPELPDASEKQGVLPRLIATLVNRRRQVKSLMKDRDVASSPAKLLQYDIKQMALKLTANSMYGCLGFTGSRFYAPSLAALTTSKGREILTNTKDLAEGQGLDVVYGDTDSVMINTNALDLALAMKTGNEFKKLVNERYRLLEIDIDGVFQRMLLLQKKKYAALKVEASGERTVEVKGLDMKRREYCQLSKASSQFILDQILSGDATEVVVEKIHDYLTELGQKVRNGEVELDDYVIFKRLGKNPKEYPDAKGQPHVQVALRILAKNGSAKSGDVIPYIFSLGEDGTTAKTAQADRARHPDDFRRTDSSFKVDYEYYLSCQVLPPIERLCDPIEGTDRARLADCLGLDPNRFQTAGAGGAGGDFERAYHTLDSQIPDAVRFQDADALRICCRHCQQTVETRDLINNSVRRLLFRAEWMLELKVPQPPLVTSAGIRCPNAECGNAFGNASIAIQLENQVRQHISRFYEGWLVCDDASCANRTRMMSVYGKRCLNLGFACRGNMHYEFTDAALYNQLLFYDTLFDAEKIRAKVQGSSRQDEVQTLVEQNKTAFAQIRATSTRYLERNGRRYVNMSSLFSFMKIAS